MPRRGYGMNRTYKEDNDMWLTINGEKKEVSGESVTIARLLAAEAVESPDMVSVQHNGRIVERGEYESVTVGNGDEIEFLYFMGGGAF